MVGPLGALLACLTAANIEVEEDVNGGAPWGRCRWVQQWPPLRMKKTPIAGPLGAVLVGSTAATTEDEEDVDGGALGGRCWWVR
jgi:hypothetical protein